MAPIDAAEAVTQRMMAKRAKDAVKRADLWRQQGNTCFKRSRFEAAIEAYTEAIGLCPGVAVYWSNRALCHLKRKLSSDWARVEKDSRRVLELDRNSVKGHYTLGLALLAKKEYAEGVAELEKALDLERLTHQKTYMAEDIWQKLAKGKYMQWEHESAQRSWELQILKDECEIALRQKHQIDAFQTKAGLVDDHRQQEANEKLFETLEWVFSKAKEDDTPVEVPGYLCCHITLDIFHDPVITPGGVTYERSVILDHLRKVGKFDPVTREELHECQLIPNVAIKEAVRSFLKKHGWAYMA